MMTRTKPNIGVVSPFPADFLSDLIRVQLSLADAIYVIAPGLKINEPNVFFRQINYSVGGNIFSQVLNQARSQLEMSYIVAKLGGKVDFWVFFGCDVFLLPVLTAKLLRRRPMLTLLGNLEMETTLKKNILNRAQIILKRINCTLSDRIIVLSDRLVKQWGLEHYNGKIVIVQSQYVDLDMFKVQKLLADRGKVVGYVGRLSPEKGIVNLLKAVPLVLEKEPDIRFVVIGDGPLYSYSVEYVKREHLENEIRLVGRVLHSEVPEYLNGFRLYILPSLTEGMPGTILEAMACGTPVLTTPVGAIMDIIADQETGFIMENSSPECIAENIIRALRHPNLNGVADLARKLVESQFSLDAARKKYQEVIACGSRLISY